MGRSTGHPMAGRRRPAPLRAIPMAIAITIATAAFASTTTSLARQAPAEPALGKPRQAELTRLVRHDCGSCHGLRLLGGLGPALTPQALAGRPIESLTATIIDGRPGTAMPGWRAMLDDEDALWIALRLVQGSVDEIEPGGKR